MNDNIVILDEIRKARILAEQMRDGRARSAMLDIAADHQRFAQRVAEPVKAGSMSEEAERRRLKAIVTKALVNGSWLAFK